MQDTDYIKLVLKHLDSEASPAEETALQQWLAMDEEHRLEYKALEKIWRESGTVLNDRSFNVEAALEKVENRLALSSPTPIRTFPWKWALAAASIFLVVGTAGWWYSSRPAVNVIRAATATLRVELPDGSIVHLRKGAVLQYSSAFMDKKERTVEFSGEAFFEPVQNPAHPFRIHTAHSILEDIGTSFLVNEQAAGDEVTVVTGKVKFTERENPSNNLILTSGHKANLSGSRFTTPGKAGWNAISWKTGILDFKDEPLQDVVADISDYYQTTVSLDPGLSENERMIKVNARVVHQPLSEVLEELRLTTGLSTRQEKGIFVFFHK
jgi:transmembrane sensor